MDKKQLGLRTRTVQTILTHCIGVQAQYQNGQLMSAVQCSWHLSPIPNYKTVRLKSNTGSSYLNGVVGGSTEQLLAPCA